MADTPQFRMADRLVGGKLVAILSERRARNDSFERIARDLFAEHGIEVTRQTVASWWKALEDGQLEPTGSD